MTPTNAKTAAIANRQGGLFDGCGAGVRSRRSAGRGAIIVLPLSDTVTGIPVRRERLGISAAWLTGGSSVARRAGGDWVRDCERELERTPADLTIRRTLPAMVS